MTSEGKRKEEKRKKKKKTQMNAFTERIRPDK